MAFDLIPKALLATFNYEDFNPIPAETFLWPSAEQSRRQAPDWTSRSGSSQRQQVKDQKPSSSSQNQQNVEIPSSAMLSAGSCFAVSLFALTPDRRLKNLCCHCLCWFLSAVLSGWLTDLSSSMPTAAATTLFFFGFSPPLAQSLRRHCRRLLPLWPLRPPLHPTQKKMPA